MLARPDGRHDLADVDAVLVDSVAHRHVLEGYLVPDGNVLRRLDRDGLVVVHDPRVQRGPRLDSLHDRDRDRVLGVMQHYVHHLRLLQRLPWAHASPRARRNQLYHLNEFKNRGIAPMNRPEDISLHAGGPLYKAVKRRLTESLGAGEWKPGQAIPTEPRLAARY